MLKQIVAFALFCAVSLCSPIQETRAIEFDDPFNATFAGIDERDTKPPVSHNCAGGWGYVNVHAAYDAFTTYKNDQSHAGQVCRGAKSCGPIEGKACWNTKDGPARLGFCNDNNYPKCVDKADILKRFAYVGYHCPRDTGTNNAAGQALYPDNTNVIFSHC